MVIISLDKNYFLNYKSVSLNIITRMEKDHKLKQFWPTFSSSCAVTKLQKKLIMRFLPPREPLDMFLGDFLA